MKALSSLMVASAIALVAIPAAKADDYDKNTKITVNEPVRLPTMTLQPGNYSLRLIEAAGNRHVVKVTDENGKGLGLILALPNYRLVPKDKTVLTYWETPPGQARAVRAWFSLVTTSVRNLFIPRMKLQTSRDTPAARFPMRVQT